MIEIVLRATADSPDIAVLSEQQFSDLLDACREQGARDIMIHLREGEIPDWFNAAKEKALTGPFRLKGAFEGGACVETASQFIAAGQRVIVSTAGMDDDAVSALLDAIRGAGWDSRRTDLFIPMPAPSPGMQAVSAAGDLVDSMTLGVGWRDATSGPTSIHAHEAADWAQSLLGVLEFWTDLHVKTYFACGFPLCIFSTRQLGKLALLDVDSPLAKCAPDLVVGPGQTIRSCFRLENAMPLTAETLSDLGRVRERLVAPIEAFRGMCDRDEAPPCRSLAAAGCGGGCLTDSMLSWTRPS